MSQHILDTLELARRMRPTDTAALVLTANHVAGRLRRMAAELNDTGGQSVPVRQYAARLDGLAAQLHAALISRPEVDYLVGFASKLGVVPADGTGVRTADPAADGTRPKGGG